MIKAIFFDIDGTLVSFDTHKIPQSTFDALYQLRQNGIKLFIATGRGKDGLNILNNFPFDGYITLNGQYCYVDNEVIYENTLKKDDLHTLLDYLDKYPAPCGFTLENDKIFNFRDSRVDEIHRITLNDDHPIGDCRDIPNKKVYQCMCFIDEEKEQQLMKLMPHSISARWHPLFCDISPKGGTKQNGIDQFLNHYHIALEDTMAFGDGGNDIEMLKHVSVSIAMGNANDELKEVADYITDTVDNDGILKALQEFNLL